MVQIEQLLTSYTCSLLTDSSLQPRFAVRPEPPEVDSDEYKQWTKNLTITYEGGYIEATYGNLAQTLAVGPLAGTCQDSPVSVIRRPHPRVNRIGMGSVQIAEARFTYNKYPKRNSGNAAGGAAYTIHTDIGSYTARIGGDVQTFMAWACARAGQFYSATSIQTGSGAWYGPITSASSSS